MLAAEKVFCSRTFSTPTPDFAICRSSRPFVLLLGSFCLDPSESIFMCLRNILVCAVALSIAPAFASKKETEAANMIERAKQASDIHAEGSSPFRLKLNFKVTDKKGGSVLQGTYTETWGSKTRWRRETTVGDFRRLEVAAEQQRWLIESGQTLPEPARNLPALVALGRLQPEVWKPERVEKRKLNGATVRCVEAAPALRAGVHIAAASHTESPSEVPTLCFDASSGVLLAEVEPQPDTYENYTTTNPSISRCCKIVSHTSSCFFSAYQKFGEREVARSFHCVEDGYPTLDAAVVELVPEPTPDPALFAPPTGGVKEQNGCPDSIRPPRSVYQPEPVSPASSGVVTITLNVGVDGAPSDLAVVSSPNVKLDRSALEAVRQWRFKPASCDGEPVSTKIAVEVDMQLR
jgi:TonB family protein